MLPFRIVDQAAIEAILEMNTVIEAVEQAYTLKADGQASLFPIVCHEFEPGKADMDMKSGHVTGAHVFGLKIVSWFGDNRAKGLPQLSGIVMVLDSRTGMPMGMLSGGYITCMRTGAAGGIGAKYLARPESEHLLIVGSGQQAPYQIMATLLTMPQIKKVSVWNPRSYAKAAAFCEAAQAQFPVPLTAVEDGETAVGEADIIITATSSRQPLILREWVQPGTHISCIGADMEGKQEIDERLFADARVFVDDVTQAVHVGETEIPVKKGIFAPERIVSEIGEVILGRAVGRQSDEDVTIFDSTGIAIQDLLTAAHVLREAEKRGLGMVVSL